MNCVPVMFIFNEANAEVTRRNEEEPFNKSIGTKRKTARRRILFLLQPSITYAFDKYHVIIKQRVKILKLRQKRAETVEG